MRTRQRRSAADARLQILDAAERRLQKGGPAALRLQDLARDLGVSHPAILHHFGSRDALINAVVDRAMRRLESSLLESFRAANDGAPDPATMLDRVFAMLVDEGQARLMAWLLLSGQQAMDLPAARARWRALTDAAHVLRPRRPGQAPSPAAREDTLFTVMLAAFATFAQAIAGDTVFAMAGLERDPRAPARFRAWLAARLAEHLMKPPPSDGRPAPRRRRLVRSDRR
ncbi:MAG TPA: helix-turn-helix domain-containing protein [Polyangia bacterium]|jgi:AcrR family transcriptional regulator